MNDIERKLVTWLYEDLGAKPARSIAFEYLLGNDADRTPNYPRDCHDLHSMLFEYTNGSMVHPWADRTNAVMRHIFDQVAAGHDPDHLLLPDLR